MKEYKNENFKVTFTSENEFTVRNKFGDSYKCRLENDKIVSNSQFGLKYAMTARAQLKF